MVRTGKDGKGCRVHSRSFRGKQETLKQNSWGTIRVYFAPVLVRGKLHVAILGQGFPGETPAGAAIVVAKVRAALNSRFRSADQPDVVFTDRGQGFYALANGRITPEYAAALRAHGLKAFMSADASLRPGDMKELMLHGTAVAWLDGRLTATTPARAWEETTEEFGARLRAAYDHINTHFRVESLCRELPDRVRAARGAAGGRLSKTAAVAAEPPSHRWRWRPCAWRTWREG